MLNMDLNKRLDEINSVFGLTLNTLLLFLKSNENYNSKILNMAKNYNVETNINFNIFTSLSDFYYRENLHSDILKFIFDPYTEKIGNKKYIAIFKKYLENKLNKKIELNLSSVKIERETNKIDLLIYDDSKNCIFIENKINNAVDMDDQIGRYYANLLKKNYKVNAIVYLTLSPLKKLNREYSIKDPNMRKIIESFLIEIPVVNKREEYNFNEDVINKCIGVSNNDVSTVYLREYSSLLKYLGGNFMADELNVEAMYKFFEDKEILKSFRILGNLWDNRPVITGKAFIEYFKNELDFSTHSEDDNSVFKTIKTDVNIGLCNDFSFGFVHTPNKQITASNKRIFKELLNNENISKYFTNDELCSDEWWVYKAIDHNKINSFNDLKKLEKDLEKLIVENM